jgi:hypothetical protein
MLNRAISSGQGRIFSFFALALVLAVYLLVGSEYRPQNIDDPWYLSFADNYVNHGITADRVFGQDAAGESGVQLFGITHAFVYGHVLNRIGWSRTNAYILSALFIFAAVFIWWHILLKLGWSRTERVVFAVGLLLAEPVFGAAHQARPDAMIFMLLAAGLYLAVIKQFFAAGLLAALAIEIHPVGGIVAVYVLSFLGAYLADAKSSLRDSIKHGLIFAAGGLLGVIYYLALHWTALPQLAGGMQAADGGGGFNNALVEYFWHTKYKRHLPELVLMLLAGLLYVVRKRWRTESFSGLSFLAGIAFLIAIRRPNFMYVIFVFPAFLLLVLAAFRDLIRPEYILAAFMVYMLPQYALVLYLNRNFDLNDYLAKLKACTPDNNLPVVGAPNDWYAFRAGDFYARCRDDGIANLKLTNFYYIAEEQAKYPASPAVKRDLSKYNLTSLTNFTANAGNFHVIRASIRKNTP